MAQKQKEVHIRVDPTLYAVLENIARREKRSVPQTARHLIEEGLRRHSQNGIAQEDPTSEEMAALLMAGGAFDWLADETDIYDDTCGEPV